MSGNGDIIKLMNNEGNDSKKKKRRKFLLIFWILIALSIGSLYSFYRIKKTRTVYPNGTQECRNAVIACQKYCSQTDSTSYLGCYNDCYNRKNLPQSCYSDYLWGLNE